MLSLSQRRSGGRSRGRLCVRHRGGGIRPRLRPLLFSQRPFPSLPAYVVDTTFRLGGGQLLLVAFVTGQLAWLPRPFGLGVGGLIAFEPQGFRRSVGSSFLLGFLPPGSPVYYLETFPGRGSRLVRSAGSRGRLLRHYNHPLSPRCGRTLVRLPSGQLRLFSSKCLASLGQLASPFTTSLYRAGDRRRLGFRPTVRGVAMNPVDHPHGGGQGKTSGGRPSVSAWGYPAKGGRTRSRRSPTNRYLISSF